MAYSSARQIINSLTTIIKYNLRELSSKKRFIKQQKRAAVKHLNSENRKVYFRDMSKYHVSVNEWIIYGFECKPEKEKKEFLSSFDAYAVYRKYNRNDIRSIFFDKVKFLNKFKNFIHRAILSPPTSQSEATDYRNKLEFMLSNYDCIFKPNSGSCGYGIFKRRKGDLNNLDDLVKSAISDQLIVEECITGCEDIQKFNPTSLNTIRLVTAFDGKQIVPFYSYVRFGMDPKSVVDNGKHGGVWCNIDLETGKINSDAVAFNNASYSSHPLTGYVFQGTQIPEWDKLLQQAISMHKGMDLPFVGWDLCVNSKGEIDVIEGNHGPDIETWQFPIVKGMRNRFNQVVDGFHCYIARSDKKKLYPHIKFK